jgi:hypothetical protein
MARKLAASTVVTNPETGAPTVIEAGAEVPDWAEGLLEDHLFEADTPREVAEEADVDDNAKPAVASGGGGWDDCGGGEPDAVEPADAGVGFATAPGPDTVAAPVDEEREPGEPRGDEGPAEQAAVGGSPAEEPKKTAARRRKAADKGDDQSE